MLFTDPVSRFPTFAAFLRESKIRDAELRRQKARLRLGGLTAAGIGGSALLTGLVSRSAGAVGWERLVLELGAAGVGGLAAYRLARNDHDLGIDNDEIARWEPVGTFRKMLELKRLHRDLSTDALAILEDIARTRANLLHELSSEPWRSLDTAGAYREVRENMELAADGAMLEAIGVLEIGMPEEVSARPPLDYLNEIAERVFPDRQRLLNSEPGLLKAAEVAHRFGTLLSEFKALGPTVMAESDRPSMSALERALGNIRAVKTAETELQLENRFSATD